MISTYVGGKLLKRASFFGNSRPSPTFVNYFGLIFTLTLQSYISLRIFMDKLSPTIYMDAKAISISPHIYVSSKLCCHVVTRASQALITNIQIQTYECKSFLLQLSATYQHTIVNYFLNLTIHVSFQFQFVCHNCWN